MSTTDIQKTVHHAKGVLQTQWVLWQQYIAGKKTRLSYNANIDPIFTIRNMRDFAGLWMKTSYNKVSHFFETVNSPDSKGFKIRRNNEMQDVTSDGILLFRESK